MSSPADTHLCLVRFWRQAKESDWHFSVQDTASGERLSFATLEDFFIHFLRMTQAGPPSPDGKVTKEAQNTRDV